MCPKAEVPVAEELVVAGVGGCGGSTLSCIFESGGAKGVELLAINTDKRALGFDYFDRKVQIGPELTSGLGAGAKPEIGALAAKESEQEIIQAIQSAEVLFLTAGMGGGTGTGAAPEVARIAHQLNIPVIAIVTRPFSFEGKKKASHSEEGILKLQEYCKAVIVLPNDRLIKVLGGQFRLVDAFEHSNRLLTDTLKALTSMLTGAGLINIDMSDFKAVIGCPGRAVMGVKLFNDSETIEDAIAEILYAPLLEEADLSLAQGAIVHISAKEEIEIGDYNRIGESIQASLSPNALVIIGLTLKPELAHDFEVMVIATGVPY